MKGVCHTTPFATLALAMALGLTGCGRSSSGGSEESGGSSAHLSRVDRDAQSAALAELQRHWLKRSDGWTTAVVSGSAYAPEHFLRQCRALTVQELQPAEVSEADKLNGLEWEGQATFKPTSCREAGGGGGMVLDGMGSFGPNRQHGQWSQWVDFTPGPLRFQKGKGGWEFRWDGTYLRGTLPGPQDFASAGVQ
jgi:hypothetical protein